MKFYFIELFHNKALKNIYKFGVTNSNDILNRFDYTYPERIGYQNFNIKPLFSIKLTDSDALKIESVFLSKYKNNNKNDYLSTNYTSKNLCGITEMRILTKEEKSEVLRILYELKTKLMSN